MRFDSPDKIATMSSPLHHAGQLVVRVPKSGSYRLFSLLFRDHTAATYRIERDAVKRAGVCPICEEPLGDRQVQAIHKHGFSREAIVHGIIAEQEEVSLTAVQKAYDAVHREKAIIAIGCQTCHKAYVHVPDEQRFDAVLGLHRWSAK